MPITGLSTKRLAAPPAQSRERRSVGTTHRVVDLGNGAGFLLDYCFFGPESADEAFEFIIRLRAKGSGHGTGVTGLACAVAAEFPGPLAREAATAGFAIEVQTAEVVGEIYGTERQSGRATPSSVLPL